MVKILHLIGFTNTPITYAESCTSLSFLKHNPEWKVWLWLIHNGLPPPNQTTYIEYINPDKIHVVTTDSFYMDMKMCNFLEIDPTVISRIGSSDEIDIDNNNNNDHTTHSLNKSSDESYDIYKSKKHTFDNDKKEVKNIKTNLLDFEIPNIPIVFSHVLRYYILYRHGGLYSDTDIIFKHAIPFRLDRNVLFVSPDKNMYAHYPAGMFYAHLPGEFIWKHLAYASMVSEKVVGIHAYGTTLLNSIFPFEFDSKGTINENLEEMENILEKIFPNVCMIDSRTYRPVPHTEASQLVSFPPMKKYEHLLIDNDPYMCFALQWYCKHPIMDLYKDICFPKKSILEKVFRSYFVEKNNVNYHKKRNKSIIKRNRARINRIGKKNIKK